MKLWRPIPVFLVLWLAISISCAKAPHLKPGYEPPEEAVANYFQAMQWQDYDEARLYVASEAIAGFDEFVKQNSKNLKIIEFKIQDTQITDDGYKARVKLKRSYIILPSVTQIQDEIEQTWKLIDGKWLLSGPPY